MEALLLRCVDGGADHHAQRGQELDDCGENESLALFEPEELEDEDEEADAAENGGQDHGGLDGLQIGCVGRVTALHWEARAIAGIPQVSVEVIASSHRDHPPAVVDGGHEEQGGRCEMEEDDEHEDDEHGGIFLSVPLQMNVNDAKSRPNWNREERKKWKRRVLFCFFARY